MLSWREALQRGLISGASASVLSSIAVGVCGLMEAGTAVGPNNAPSQWVWGQRAAHRRGLSWKHTALGYLIHHLSSVFWATLHERHFARPAPRQTVPYRLATSAVTAAAACFVDYRVAPFRLRPGFEKHVGRGSLLLVYTAFALGLAAGGMRVATRTRGEIAKHESDQILVRPGALRRADGRGGLDLSR